MVSELVPKLLFSAIDLLKGSLVFSLPVFVVVLIAVFFGKFLMKKYKFNWLSAAGLTTYVFTAIILFIIYFTPILQSLGQTTIGTVPDMFQPTPQEIVGQILGVPARLLIVSLFVALLLLPLEFVGSYVYDFLSKKYSKLNHYVRAFAAVFAATLFAWFLILFIFQLVFGIDLITGLLYLIFYGFAY